MASHKQNMIITTTRLGCRLGKRYRGIFLHKVKTELEPMTGRNIANLCQPTSKPSSYANIFVKYHRRWNHTFDLFLVWLEEVLVNGLRGSSVEQLIAKQYSRRT